MIHSIKKVIDWKIKFYIYIDLIIKETSIERSISFSSSVIFLFEIKFQRIISLVISLIIDIQHEKEKKGYYLKSIGSLISGQSFKRIDLSFVIPRDSMSSCLSKDTIQAWLGSGRWLARKKNETDENHADKPCSPAASTRQRIRNAD